ASRRVHARVYDNPEEAELGASQGRPCSPDLRHRDHRLHPRRWPQPSGALDRARSRWPSPRSARRSLQGHPRGARHPGCQEPQASSIALRSEEGEGLMPRKGPAAKRPIVIDPVYSSPVVTQLVNKVLLDGKRSTAERIVYGALEGCREKTGTDPVQTL